MVRLFVLGILNCYLNEVRRQRIDSFDLFQYKSLISMTALKNLIFILKYHILLIATKTFHFLHSKLQDYFLLNTKKKNPIFNFINLFTQVLRLKNFLVLLFHQE